MAIYNYIKDMQKKIETKNFIEEFSKLQMKAKNIFIFKSVLDYLEQDDLELFEAQYYVEKNKDHIKFETTNLGGLSQKWKLTIHEKTYEMDFNVKEQEGK